MRALLRRMRGFSALPLAGGAADGSAFWARTEDCPGSLFYAHGMLHRDRPCVRATLNGEYELHACGGQIHYCYVGEVSLEQFQDRENESSW